MSGGTSVTSLALKQGLQLPSLLTGWQGRRHVSFLMRWMRGGRRCLSGGSCRTCGVDSEGETMRCSGTHVSLWA